MKKIALFLFALLISVSVFSQQNVPRNEISLNLFNTAILQYPEISFERILNHDMSVGASIGAGGHGDYFQSFNLTPFARWFFGGNRGDADRLARGFFIEANCSFFRYKNRWTYEDGHTSAFGIGLGIGWKYLTRGNWTGEVLFGGGRDMINDGGYLRLGISIGRRF